MRTAPWLNPVVIVLCWAAVVLAAWQTPTSSYYDLMRSNKYVDAATVLTALLLYGFFALGSFLASASAGRRGATAGGAGRERRPHGAEPPHEGGGGGR